MTKLTKLEVWNARTSCSQTKNEEDEGETGVEMLKTKESPDGLSPAIQRELNELREYLKGISKTATGRVRLFTKSKSHWLNKYPLRDILTLKDKILREQRKDTAPVEEQLNLIAVEQERLRKDRSAPIYEATRISEEKEAMTRDVDALNLKVEKLGGQCKRSASLEEQLNQMTMECNELRRDREALIYVATRISEEKEAMARDEDALNLKEEKLGGQCKGSASLEEQLNQMTMECNELRRDREALIYETTRISEEKEAMTRDEDDLKLEVEKLREQCKKAAALENELNQMKVECNELRKDKEALMYEVLSILEEKEIIKLEKDVLNLEIENIRIEFRRKF